MDPEFITSADWARIGNLLHFFWYAVLCSIGFGFNFLLAHAIIPSLVSTGHIPQSVNKARRMFYIGALGFLSLVVLNLIIIASKLDTLTVIWDRSWI